MQDQLLENVEYKIDETRHGTWRRFEYVDGSSYQEFTSKASLLGIPLVHYTCGRNPETGRRRIAKGVIAVGRLSFGIIAVGHASFGLIAVGQLALGVIFGLGQLATGAGAIGQFAIGVFLALGHFATGYIAIGQFVWGYYGLGQFGVGRHLWTMSRCDAEAMEFFKSFLLSRSFLR